MEFYRGVNFKRIFQIHYQCFNNQQSIKKGSKLVLLKI